MITRDEIVDIARGLKGVPYRHQGRTRQGLDCVGVLIAVADRAGLEYQDPGNYSRLPETFSLKQEMDRILAPVAKTDIQPGDALLFKIDVLPQHVAIVTDYRHGGLGMVHCYQSAGKVVEHRLAKIWLARLVQAYKIPEGVR